MLRLHQAGEPRRGILRSPLALLTLLPLLLGLTGYASYAARRAPDETISTPPWNVATGAPDRVILTWSADPTSSQSVTWRTDTTVARGMAQIALASPGPGFGLEAQTVVAESRVVDARAVENAGVVVKYHSVTFTRLVPDTLYAYRVGDGEEWTEWYQFRTASREKKPFAFLYFGDAQNDILPLWSRVIRGAFAEAPEARFMLHAGDLVTDAHSDLQWGEWFRAGSWIHAMVPSMPAPGNHEYEAYTSTAEGEDDDHLSVFWRAQFELPTNGPKGQEETSYFFDYQGARILVLNPNAQREDQAAWLRRVLRENPQPWTIATFHQPIYSSGKDRDNAALRALWKPVFDEESVDLVLQGHDHTYARGWTAPAVQGGGALAMPATNAREHETGPVYVVSVGGRKMYTFKKDRWDKYDAKLDRRAENTQLFQVVRIAGDTLRFQAFTATGQVYDAFDILRDPRGRRPNTFVERMNPDAPVRTFADGPRYTW